MIMQRSVSHFIYISTNRPSSCHSSLKLDSLLEFYHFEKKLSPNSQASGLQCIESCINRILQYFLLWPAYLSARVLSQIRLIVHRRLSQTICHSWLLFSSRGRKDQTWDEFLITLHEDISCQWISTKNYVKQTSVSLRNGSKQRVKNHGIFMNILIQWTIDVVHRRFMLFDYSDSRMFERITALLEKTYNSVRHLALTRVSSQHNSKAIQQLNI